MTISLDPNGSAIGSYNQGSGTTATITISTTNTNDVIILDFTDSAIFSTATPTSPNLTWNSHADAFPASTIRRFYAIALAALSGEVITISGLTSGFSRGTAFAVSGADTASPFDSGGPVTSNSGPDPLSITVANTGSSMVIGYYTCNTPTSPGPGYTTINSAAGDFALSEYQVVSGGGAQSVTIGSGGTGTASGGIIDAIKASATIVAQIGRAQGTIFLPAGRGRGPARGLSRTLAYPQRAITAQTISVNATTATTMLKNIGKSVAATCISTVSAISAAFQAGLSVGMQQGFLFKPGHGPMWDIKRRQAFPPGPTTAQFNQTVSVNATTSVSTLKSTAHVIGILCGATVSLVKGVGKSIAVACSGAVTMIKSAAKTFLIACTTSVIFSALKVKLVTISVNCTTSVAAIGKSIGKSITISVSTVISLRKSVAHSVMVACTGTVTIGKGIGKVLSVSVNSLISLVLTGTGIFAVLRRLDIRGAMPPEEFSNLSNPEE